MLTKNMEDFLQLFSCLAKSADKPELFAAGEIFWEDAHISKGLLKAHLDPAFEGASRKPSTIEATVSHLVGSGLLQSGDRVLDLGCGPGLYSNRLCQYGISVTGIDLSSRSLEYARKKAEEQKLAVSYIQGSFFDINDDAVFDRVMQVYGELCTFSDQARDKLLAIIHKALKKDGLFIFDVSTRALRKQVGLGSSWQFAEEGFWHPGKHLVLEQGIDYPDSDVWLDQYIVISEDGQCKTYRMWFHDYCLQTMTQVLENSGFIVKDVWNSLTGQPYQDGGDWLAIAAQKI